MTGDVSADRLARDAGIVRLFRQGLTQQVIAERYGLSKMRVCQVLHSSGLDRSDGGKQEMVRRRDFGQLEK